MKSLSSKNEHSNKLNKVAEILLLAYMAECTCGSSGRWLEIGPLSIRMVLFILCFLATLPAVLCNIKQLSRNVQVIVTVCFGVYTLFSAWYGLRTGNELRFIWADVSSLIALALVPGFVVTVCNKQAIKRMIDVIFWAAFALALVTVIIHFAVSAMGDDNVNLLNYLINVKNLGGLALLATGIHRIYLRSQIFLQVAIVYGVWKIGNTPEKKRKTLYVAEGILLCACILSYTRGFWLGLASSAVLLLLMGKKYWKDFFKIAGVMLAILIAFMVISTAVYRGPYAAIEIVNRFNPNLIVLGESNDRYDQFLDSDQQENSSQVNTEQDPESDEMLESDKNAVKTREETLRYLKIRIKQHPVIGNGLGENLDEIRLDGKTEYMYLDIWMKSGIIGLVLFLLTFFSFVVIQIKTNYENSDKRTELDWNSPIIRNWVLTAAYLGVTMTSFFNPFLNNPMGIALLMITSTAIYCGE